MAPSNKGFMNCLRIAVRSWPVLTDLFLAAI